MVLAPLPGPGPERAPVRPAYMGVQMGVVEAEGLEEVRPAARMEAPGEWHNRA